MAINLMNIISPKEFEQIRDELIKNSSGRYTLESLEESGFTYENHLLYALNFNDRGYFPDIDEDIDSLASFTNKSKFAEKLSYFNEVVYSEYTPEQKFKEIKRLLLENNVYSRYEMDKIGFTYDRYQSFGPNAFFKNIYYKKESKRGPKPLKDRIFISNPLPDRNESIAPGKPLFNPINNPQPQDIHQTSFDFNNPNSRIVNKELEEKYVEVEAHKILKSLKNPELVNKSLFEEPQKIVSPKITSKSQLGDVVRTYPLQFFDTGDKVSNKQTLDFFNEYLKSDKNTRNLKFKMANFSEAGIRIRQTKVRGMDNDYFGDMDVVNKRVMVLLPEGQKKEKAIAIVKQGDNSFKFVEAQMEYNEEGMAFVKNLSVKSSGAFFSPFSENVIKDTINGSKYVTVRNIGDTSSGIQEVLNENYQKFFDIIFQNDGNVNAITDIAREIDRSSRLVTGRSLDIIKDATMVSTRHAVSSDGIYNGKIIISGENLLDGMHISKEVRESLNEKGYNKGRYALETNEEGKIKGIYRAVSKDGKIAYEKDEDMFEDIFRNISQYTDSYVMERAKLVDSDLKNIVSTEDIVNFNKKIRSMNIFSEDEVNAAAEEMRNIIFDKYANEYGYNTHQEMLKDIDENGLEDVYSTFLAKVKRVDLETIKARIESGQLFDNRLVEIKDKTTSAGIERIISAGFMHPLNYLNKDNARKTQGIQQMSAFGFNNLEGKRVTIARVLEQQTNHIKELQSKKITIRRTAEEGLFNLFGKRIFGDNFVTPDLSANTVSYLYGDFEEVFNDSSVVSALAVMKNIGDKGETKKIRIDYSSLNPDIIKGLGKEHADVGSLINYLQNGQLDIGNIGKEGSFENTFFTQLLGEDNVKKFALYKQTNDFQNDIENLGKLFENIQQYKNKEDMIKYGEASDKAMNEYNRILKKYMLLSDSASNINIINKNVVNKDVKTFVADATAGLIENIVADSAGIEIEFSSASLFNSGAKGMLENTKFTLGKVYNTMAVVNNGRYIPVDALVNNKLTNAKRGNAGSILSMTLETMLRNTMTADFKSDMTPEQRLNYFKNMFSSEKMGGGKASILDALNIDFKLNEDGSIDFIDKNVNKAIADTPMGQVLDPYTTLEKRIRDNFLNNLKGLFGGSANEKSAEALYSTLEDNLFVVYNKILDDMTEESRDINQVMFKAPEIQKVFTGVDGKQQIVTEKAKGYVYNFKGRMNRMVEATSRKNSNALRLSRISQLLATASGNESFIGTIKDMAMEQNKGNVLDFAAVYDLDEQGYIRNKEIFENFVNDAKLIDVSDSKFRNMGAGISNTVEGFKSGPLGNIITEVRNQDKSINTKKVKSIITGFEEGFLNDVGMLFKDTKKTKESISRMMFFGALDEMLDKSDLSGDSEIIRKLEVFKHNVQSNKIQINNIIPGMDLFNISNDQVRNLDFDELHSNLIDVLSEQLGLDSEFTKVLKNTSDLNTDYYKFASTMNSMLDRLSGNAPEDLDLFMMNDLLHFEKLDLDILDKYKTMFPNDVLYNIVSDYRNLSDGRIIHLARLKQLYLNKELPVYITGLLSDEAGRVIPNSALADLIGLTGDLANLHLNKEAEIEYKKIAKFSSEFKNNRKTWAMSKWFRQFDSENYKKLKRSNEAINHFLSIFGSDADLNKIYEDNKYEFYKIASKFAGDNEKVLDDEISRKFRAFKRAMRENNFEVSNSFSQFLKNMGVENSNQMNVISSLFSKEDVTFQEFLQGYNDLKTILRSANDKANRSSLSAINDILVQFEGFLDDTVKGRVMDLFGDFQTISKYALDDKVSVQDLTALVGALGTSKSHFKKIEEMPKWISPLINRIIEKSNNYEERSNTSRRIINRLFSLYEGMGEGIFGKDGMIQEAGTFIAEHSVRFSPRNASGVDSIVTDSIKDIFGNKHSKEVFDEKIDQIEDFVKVIFGDDASKEIHNKLEHFKKMKGYTQDELNWIGNFLADKQNIVIGNERMYQVAGLRLDFGDSYSAYGILQRDPSQFFGSVSSARYVKIDSKNKRFDNDLYRRLFGNVGGIDNTANLMFIGRTTGLWFNGDFDGDTFQAMIMGLRNKDLFNQFQQGSGELYSKFFELQHLITNSGDANLVKEFRSGKLQSENSKSIYKLILELYGGEKKINENTPIGEVFNIIKPYYLQRNYYRRKIKSVLEDELLKHADTQLSGKQINGISQYALGDLHLALDLGKQKRIISREMSLDEFEKIFNSINPTLSKYSQKEFESAKVEDIFEALKVTFTPQGQLGLANLFGEANKVGDFTSIARTGRFHDSISEYREFSMAFVNEADREAFKMRFAKNFENFYGKNSEEELETLLKNIGSNLVDDIFGDLIEQGSIGGKHGASANPYEIIERMNAIARITSKGGENDKSYVKLNKINEFIEDLLGETAGNGKVYTDKTIGDVAEMLFLTGDKGYKTPKVQGKIREMTEEIGKLLNITADDINEIGATKLSEIEDLTTDSLAGILTIVKTAAAKGYVEKVTDITNISRGLTHKLASKNSFGAKVVSWFQNFYGENKTQKIQGDLSSDSNSAMSILRKFVGIFAGHKNINEDIKKEAEETTEKINDPKDIKVDTSGAKKVVDDAKEEAINAGDTISKRLYRQETNKLKDTITQQQQQIDELQQQLNKVANGASEAAGNASTASSGTKKTASKIVEEGSELLSNAKQQISKHKSGFMVASALVALGTFFRIFQSNRAVVNLDINEKQYEKSQGSIYRDLNRYTINTNIRELY